LLAGRPRGLDPAADGLDLLLGDVVVLVERGLVHRPQVARVVRVLVRLDAFGVFLAVGLPVDLPAM
jgi:hypothetical protein